MERKLSSAGGCLAIAGHARSVWTVSLLLLVISAGYSSLDIYHGQNVCTHTKYQARPIHIRQSVQRPVHTLDLEKCKEEGESPCHRTVTTYRTVYQSKVRMRIQTVTVPGCCKGWRKRSPHDISCLQSECSRPCENGGECVGRESCSCPAGFTGTYCHTDIDECSREGRSPCQQECTNTPGSFNCSCTEGFKLGDDGRSCKLCLSCSREFQELQAQMVSLPDELGHVTQKLMRTNIQSDMKQAMERQEENFEKLQSQHDTIMAIQKQMDALPEMAARLENLTALHAQIHELQGLETRLDSVQDEVGDGFASLKASQTGFTEALELAEKRWQKGSVASSKLQSEAMERLQWQQDQMVARIGRLEQDNAKLQENLTTILAMYESAMSALQQKDTAAPTRKPESTTLPGIDDDYYLQHSSSSIESVSRNRISSISQQISVLEEKLSMCNCNGAQYPNY